MSDDELNATIDDVARQMTAALPTDENAFRRRVLARLEPSASRLRFWRAAFAAAAIAAVALIVIVEFRGGEPRRATTIAPPPRPTVAERPVLQDPAERPRPAAPATQQSARSIRAAAGAPATVAAPTLALETSEIDPLDVAPLTVSPLTSDPIQVERLESIAPIAVAPLDAIDPQRRFE